MNNSLTPFLSFSPFLLPVSPFTSFCIIYLFFPSFIPLIYSTLPPCPSFSLAPSSSAFSFLHFPFRLYFPVSYSLFSALFPLSFLFLSFLFLSFPFRLSLISLPFPLSSHLLFYLFFTYLSLPFSFSLLVPSFFFSFPPVSLSSFVFPFSFLFPVSFTFPSPLFNPFPSPRLTFVLILICIKRGDP